MSRIGLKLSLAFVTLATSMYALSDSRLGNISTRAHTGTGDQVVIAGFIIEGSEPKDVLIRAHGAALASFGVAGSLMDPELSLFRGATLLENNNSWQEHVRASEIPAALQPAHAEEAAILRSLEPGAYTAHLRGVASATGISLVEVWELDETSRLVNISTRAQVETDDSVMIGGFIASGDEDITVVVRARGPSLAAAGVSGALENPTLLVYAGQTLIDQNDDWQSHNRAADIPADLVPTGATEAALIITVPPGPYTAIVQGSGGTTGIGIVEVFRADPRDTDGDGVSDATDADDDGDMVDDGDDAFPLDATESVDSDGDGVGDNADVDDDNDSVADVDDAFPLDATESVDTDGDGTGNNADADDDNDGVTDVNDPEPLNPLVSAESPTGLGGLWTGSMQATRGSSGTHSVKAISTADGRMRLYSEESFQTLIVTINDGPGNSFTAAGAAYPEFDQRWADGSTVTSTSLEGTLVPGVSLFGTWSNNSNDAGTFSLTYNPDYETPPGLAGLAGRWTSFDEDGVEIALVELQANGTFNGDGAFGCQLFGQLSEIDPTYNAYNVVISTSGCTGNSGTFLGFGTLVSPTKFILTLNDSSFAVINELRKN